MRSIVLFFSIVGSLLLKAQANANANSAQLKSARALTHQLSAGKLEASLKDGFHFNEQAPNQVQLSQAKKPLKPSFIAKQKMQFSHSQFKKGMRQTALAELYVCDDANTYCETHSIQLGQGKPQENVSGKVIQSDAVEKGLQKVSKNKKLLLLNFSARWCPGCVRYQEEIFATSEFKNASKNYVLQKVDVDLFENFHLSEKYKIPGIPTLIVLNHLGEEIDRIVDFQPLSSLLPFLQNIQEDSTPIVRLKAQVTGADPAVLLKTGKRFLASGLGAEAVEVLQKLKPSPAELAPALILQAQNNFAKDKGEKSRVQLMQMLHKQIEAEAKSSRSLAWRVELIKLLAEQKESKAQIQKIVTEAEAVVQELLKDDALLKQAMLTDSAGELIGYEKIAIMLYLLNIYEAAGLSNDDNWRKTADIAEKYQISAKDSGPARRYLIILSSAKMYEKAEKFANEILQVEPANFDVQRRLSKIYLALNKNKQALQLAKKILPGAEGRNRFWITESIVKAQVALGEKSEAKKLIKATLAESEMDSPSLQSVKKTLQELSQEL